MLSRPRDTIIICQDNIITYIIAGYDKVNHTYGWFVTLDCDNNTFPQPGKILRRDYRFNFFFTRELYMTLLEIFQKMLIKTGVIIRDKKCSYNLTKKCQSQPKHQHQCNITLIGNLIFIQEYVLSYHMY